MTRPSKSAKFRAAVAGGTGYGGAELIRLLLAHPSVALARVSSIDHVDERLQIAGETVEQSGCGNGARQHHQQAHQYRQAGAAEALLPTKHGDYMIAYALPE